VAMDYNLYNNTNRVVAFDPATGKPVDKTFQESQKQIPPQIHY
jgi:hypothetical protein